MERGNFGGNVHTQYCWISSSTQETSQSRYCISKPVVRPTPYGTSPSSNEQLVGERVVSLHLQFAAPTHVVDPAVDEPLSPAEFRHHAAPSHTVAAAVDDPLFAVQNMPHVCLYLFASADYSTVPSLPLIQMLSALCHALSSGVTSLRTFVSFVLTW